MCRQRLLFWRRAFPFFRKVVCIWWWLTPGVGGGKHGRIAVETPGAFLVAPDNGVLSYTLTAIGDYRAVELSNPEYQMVQTSNTFHGRDIFAPAAAHLAMGVPLDEFGERIGSVMMLEEPHLRVSESGVEGEVLMVDRFGNLRTSIGQMRWDGERLSLRPGIFGGRQAGPEVSFEADVVKVKVGSLMIDGITRTF